MQHCSIKLQKEVKSNPKNIPAVKKMCGPQEGHCEKSCESRWWPRMAANSKNFSNDNSAEFVLPLHIHYDSAPNSPELSLLQFLLLSYHHSHSWPPPGFHSFFHNGLLGGHTLFLQLGCFWIK